MSISNSLFSITTRYPYSPNDQWGKNLLYLLSTDPKISRIVDRSLPSIPAFKGNHLIPFKMNDKSFFIDDWDYSHPTSSIINSSIPDYYLQDNKPIILKVQYDSNHKDIYNQIYDKYNIKVLPFIIFPSKVFNLEFDKWNKDINHNYLCFHTGRIWKERHVWVKYLQEFHGSDIPKIENQGLSIPDYEQLLLKTKWGLILKGKGVGKNRREVEYMSIGMPLALNYKPEYPFPYNPNEHYVYLEKPSDISNLVDIDPQPYAEKSIEIYNKYYSVKTGGLYHSFNTAYLQSQFI
jgi:hypothetical protein